MTKSAQKKQMPTKLAVPHSELMSYMAPETYIKDEELMHLIHPATNESAQFKTNLLESDLLNLPPLISSRD